MVINKTYLKLIALIQLSLVIFSSCAHYDSYVSFAKSDKLPQNRCRFNSLAETVNHYSNGLLTDDSLLMDQVLSCVELYSRTYYMNLNADRKVEAKGGIKIGYGFDYSALATNLTNLNEVGEDAFLKLTESEDRLKEFTEEEVNNVLALHSTKFKSVLTERLRVNTTDNFAALPESVRIALFLVYLNNYEFGKTTGEKEVNTKVDEFLFKNNYRGLAAYLQSDNLLNIPTPRRLVAIALLNSFQTAEIVKKVKILVVTSGAPTVLTKNLTAFLQSSIQSTLQQVESFKTNTTNPYVEFSLVTVSKSNFSLAINGTGVNRVGTNLTELNAQFDALSPFDIGEGESASLNATIIQSAIDLAFNNTVNNLQTTHHLVLVFSKTSEFLLNYVAGFSPHVTLVNFNLLTTGRDGMKAVSYPYTYGFESYNNLAKKNFNIFSFVKDTPLMTPLNSFVRQTLDSNVRYFQFNKNSENDAVLYVRNVDRLDNTTDKFAATVYVSYSNPRPETVHFSDKVDINNGYRIVFHNEESNNDLRVSAFNRNPSTTTNTVYVAIKNNNAYTNDLLLKFGECDDTVADCKFGISLIGPASPAAPVSPVSPLDPAATTATNYTTVNVIFLIISILFVSAAAFILVKTPKVENASSMRALSEMSSK